MKRCIASGAASSFDLVFFRRLRLRKKYRYCREAVKKTADRHVGMLQMVTQTQKRLVGQKELVAQAVQVGPAPHLFEGIRVIDGLQGVLDVSPSHFL